MQPLWATQVFLIGILFCSLAGANSVNELLQQRDALDHELKVYEQLLHSGRIIVPNLFGAPTYYTPEEFGLMLPQSMIEQGYKRDSVVDYLSGVIKYHNTVMQEIRTDKIPRMQKEIQQLNNQLSAMTPVPPNVQPVNSGNKINHNIYSSNYGQPENTPNIPTDHDKLTQELMMPQGGIVATITQKHQCKYRSGGDPDNKSNHFCRVEFSIENTTNKTINFSSGFTETEHEWNGGFKRERVGYTYNLQPGKTMKLSSQCIIPHRASHGNWKAWGTGFHYGHPNKEQFSWSIGTRCP